MVTALLFLKRGELQEKSVAYLQKRSPRCHLLSSPGSLHFSPSSSAAALALGTSKRGRMKRDGHPMKSCTVTHQTLFERAIYASLVLWERLVVFRVLRERRLREESKNKKKNLLRKKKHLKSGF